MDHEILIPKKYSIIGVFSSIFILKTSIFLFFYDEIIAAHFSLLSYIFTNLHWYNLKKKGTIRNIDILCAVSYCFYGLYRANYLDCNTNYFYINNFFNISAFLFNEYLNYNTMYSDKFHKNYSYHTQQLIYIISVIIHTLFLHILQSQNIIYTVIVCNK